MKTKTLVGFLALLALSSSFTQAAPLGTAFTYQGRLSSGTNAASGSYDLKFSLFDALTSGNQVGASLTNTAAGVTNGLFTVTLDFGSVFDGNARWLEIGVRTNGSGAFSTLAPRQPLTASPYALYAPSAGTAALANTVAAGIITSVNIADGTITTSDIGAGQVTSANLASSLAISGDISAGSFSLNTVPTLRTVGTGNSFVGANAGNLTMSGTENTANGTLALQANTTGYRNTANGYEALYYNASGLWNTANGYEALYRNTSGNFNTANGHEALYSNTNGNENTATGNTAMHRNTTGVDNTGDGYSALFYNTTGSSNTAVGVQALYSSTTGDDNTAIGCRALYSGTNLYDNTAIGYEALRNETLGSGNIAIGYQAGWQLFSGYDNIYLGNPGVGGDNGVIRIGSSYQATTYIAGIYNATVSGGSPVYIGGDGQLGTLPSSRRFKSGIQDMDQASDVLLALRPVTFRYKPELDPKGLPQFGLIAEEVERVNPDLVVHDAQGKPYAVRYEQVNAMLLNEVLKEHRKVEEQGAAIADLKARLEQLEQFLNSKNGGGQ